MPEFPTGGDRKGSFYFFPADGPTLTADRLIEVVSKRIPENFGLDWTQDVQVIAPMYKGDAGVDALNDRLRDAAGYGGREIERGGRIWRVGDRVIQTRNDYEKNVFNGDMGRITEVSADGVVTVKFSDQTQTYIKGEINDLRPAFAITVHRSQGGEFPCVVMPLVRGHRVMLQRNLLYTAITRAEQLVVLVGSETALRWAVETADQAQRMSMLTERLVDICEGPTTKD
jgi:exodeoxyribonuclease V alpha subunit